MTIILSDCVKGSSMGLIGMQGEGHNNIVVVEMVAKNAIGVSVHGISNVLHLTNIVCWTRHGWDIEIVHGMGIHFALTDFKMCDDNWPVWTLVGAMAMVNLGNAWGFLIGVCLQVTTCVHVGMLCGCGSCVLDKNWVESGGRSWNSVNEWFISICNHKAGKLLGPSMVENSGRRNPTLG